MYASRTPQGDHHLASRTPQGDYCLLWTEFFGTFPDLEKQLTCFQAKFFTFLILCQKFTVVQKSIPSKEIYGRKAQNYGFSLSNTPHKPKN